MFAWNLGKMLTELFKQKIMIKWLIIIFAKLLLLLFYFISIYSYLYAFQMYTEFTNNRNKY